MATPYFILLASFLGFVSSSNDCDACIESICYSKTPILSGYHFSGQLAVDRKENIVYFHYEDSQSIDCSAAFDLDDIRFSIIPNIDFSFARAVDQSTREVYLGGARGIYKYNPSSNKTTQYGLLDQTIWQMQFKNKIYYTIFQMTGLHTFESKQSKSISALSDYMIDDFVIDNSEDIYFLSQSNVYRLKKGAKEVTVIANDIYSLSIDKFEIVHFFNTGKKGLYKLDSTTNELIELGAFGSGIPLKSAFDNNNNIIFHENKSRKLYYLMPNYGRCSVSSRSRGGPMKPIKQSQNENEIDSELFIHRLNSRNTR